ncbi:hypothetical protein ACIQAC_01360 [Streptomyces sp. NPDC088387]|uniref:hypothetical protein n=1 Tax=Streptomyces sp. NPDC088387 TaxID=3365859 RepID=UPI0038072E1C
MERTDQPDPQPTPHTARDCALCGTLRHPAQAKAGRALRTHLAANPLPRQAAGR